MLHTRTANLLFDPNQLWWKTVQTLNYPINERDLDRKVKLLVRVLVVFSLVAC